MSPFTTSPQSTLAETSSLSISALFVLDPEILQESI